MKLKKDGHKSNLPDGQENKAAKGKEDAQRITYIPAVTPSKTIRVAVYARVSTEFEEQDESYDVQQTYYNAVIQEHPGWELVGIFHERQSGTHMEDRTQLQLLLEECRRKRVDLVLTKSISRFSRSTADLLTMTRTLTSYGTRIFFEKERIDTGQIDGEMLLTILAWAAEMEVHSTSENNKWAIRKRFQSGIYKHACAPYGYECSGTSFIICEEEAAIVRTIFADFLSGKGPTQIARELNDAGVPTKRAADHWVKRKPEGMWSAGGIRAILKNNTYLGTVVYQKTFHDDDFRVRPNHGEQEMYYLEGHHDPIISRETFERVQALIAQHAKTWNCDGTKSRRRYERSWSNSTVNYLLSNEKYMGDLRLQKFCTPDFLTKKHVRNKGQMPQYYVENSHLPIVPKEIFCRVQGEKQRRLARKEKVLLSNCLCGKTFCADCGTRYLRKMEQHGRTKFRCGTRMHRKYRIEGVTCETPAIAEKDLQIAVMNAFRQLPAKREELLVLWDRINDELLPQEVKHLAELEDRMNALTRLHEMGKVPDEAEENAIRMLQEHMAEAGLKKAELLNREAQIRTLLSRIDAMRGMIAPKRTYESFCSDVDEFFERTRPDFTPGPVSAFIEDDTSRFVERINIGTKQVEVVFWAGVSVVVGRAAGNTLIEEN